MLDFPCLQLFILIRIPYLYVIASIGNYSHILVSQYQILNKEYKMYRWLDARSCELHCKLIRIYVIWTLNFIHYKKKHQTHEGIRKKTRPLQYR